MILAVKIGILFKNHTTPGMHTMMNILVIEDDIPIIQYLCRLINGWGYRVDKAVHGREALSKLQNQSFDLILLDIFLTDTDAAELIPRIKTIRPDTPIITITGHNTREVELKIRKLGVVAFLTKPIENKELKLILEHMSKNHAPINHFKRRAKDDQTQRH